MQGFHRFSAKKALVYPAKIESYTVTDLNQTRDKMIDYASLKILDHVSDHNIRETLSTQLQSQKNKLFMMDDRKNASPQFLELLADTQDFALAYIHSDSITQTYSPNVIGIYAKVLQRTRNNGPKQTMSFKHQLKRTLRRYARETTWHIANSVITRAQRERFRKNKLTTDSTFAANIKKWTDTRDELIALNNDLTHATDIYLDDKLRERLDAKHNDNDHIYFVREAMNRFFNRVKRDYKDESAPVSSALYIQAFQYEYDFVQQGVSGGSIVQTMASTLFKEINQAQMLQLDQTEQFDTDDYTESKI